MDRPPSRRARPRWRCHGRAARGAAVRPRPVDRDGARPRARRPLQTGRGSGAGGVRVRRDVLGAEVAVGVVGADRRPPAPRGARYGGECSARAPGAVRVDDSHPLERRPAAPGHERVDDGHVPPDHLPSRRPADPHPCGHLRQGADGGWSLAGAGRPLPEAAPADARRPLPIGPARRAHPPVRRRLAPDRQRSGRDRRRPRRAPRRVLETDRRHRRSAGRQARRLPPT